MTTEVFGHGNVICRAVERVEQPAVGGSCVSQHALKSGLLHPAWACRNDRVERVEQPAVGGSGFC